MPTKVQIARARARVSVARVSGETLPDEVIQRAKLDFGDADEARGSDEREPSTAADIAGQGASFRRQAVRKFVAEATDRFDDVVDGSEHAVGWFPETPASPTPSSSTRSMDVVHPSGGSSGWRHVVGGSLPLDIRGRDGVPVSLDLHARETLNIVFEVRRSDSGDLNFDVVDDLTGNQDAPARRPRT